MAHLEINDVTLPRCRCGRPAVGSEGIGRKEVHYCHDHRPRWLLVWQNVAAQRMLAGAERAAQRKARCK